MKSIHPSTHHGLTGSKQPELFTKMAPGQKMYPRGTVKKIVKAHSNCSVSKNVDVLVRFSVAGRVS